MVVFPSLPVVPREALRQLQTEDAFPGVGQYQQMWACYKVLQQKKIQSYRIREGQALQTKLPCLGSRKLASISVKMRITCASANWCVSVKNGDLLIPDFELEVTTEAESAMRVKFTVAAFLLHERDQTTVYHNELPHSIKKVLADGEALPVYPTDATLAPTCPMRRRQYDLGEGEERHETITFEGLSFKSTSRMKPVHIIFALILDDEDCKEIAAVVFQPPTVCVRSNSQRDVRLKALQNLGYRDALCNHEDGHAPPNLPVPNNSSLRSRPRKVSSLGSALDYLRHTPQQHVAPARHSVCTLPIAPPTPPALQQGVAPSWGEQQSLDELHAGAGPSLGSVPGQPLRPQQSWEDGPNQLQLQGSRFGPDPITSGIVVPSMSQQSTHASPWHTPQSAPSPEVQVAHGDPAYGSEVNVPAPMPRQSQQAPGRTQHPHQQLQAVAAGISGRDKRRRSALGGHAGSHSMPCTPEPGDGRSWGTGYIENLSAGTCFPQGSASGQPRHSPLQPGLASPTDPMHGGDASVIRPEVSTHIPSRRQQPTGLQVEQYASRAHGEEWAPPILRTSVLEPGSLWHSTQHRSDVGASHPATHGMSADSGAGHSSFPQALQAQFRDMWPERVSVGPLSKATPSSQHAPVNAYVTHGPDSIDTDCYVGCSTPAAQVRGAVPGPSGVSVQAGAPHAASAGTYAPSQIPSVPGIFEPVGGLIATTAHDPSSAEVDLQPAKPHENQSSFCHVRCWDDLEGLRTKRPRYDDQDELTKEEFDDALAFALEGP